MDSVIINGLQKLTLLDFPGHTACTVFTGGCNFRCPFCHNASLVLRAEEQPTMAEDDFFAFLNKRRGLLDGVCITGGEPTLQPDLPEFLSRIRAMGFAAKLDTNGYRPNVLRRILDSGLADYVAMDIKAPLSRYGIVAGVVNINTDPVKESIGLIMSSGTDYEFRTTVVDELHTAEDFEEIGKLVCGARRYFVQSYKDSGDLIDNRFSAASREKLDEIVGILKRYVKSAEVRGVD